MTGPVEPPVPPRPGDGTPPAGSRGVPPRAGGRPSRPGRRRKPEPPAGDGPPDVTQLDWGRATARPEDPTRTRTDAAGTTSLDPTVTRREFGPTGTRPAAPGTTGESPVSGAATQAPGDDIRVRFGAGPTVPRMWNPESVPARHRRGNARVAPFLSVAASMVVIGGLLAWLAFRDSPAEPLAVSGVEIAAPGGEQRCDPDRLSRTVKITATVQLNGEPGILTYRWVQSDGTPGDFHKATILADQTRFEAPLQWTVSGEGRKQLTATFELDSPEKNKSSATFEYLCRP
ncbi:hypothetical protein LO762_25945 [Actinocorallia sp. API 0066]|uniref:hypothetical protein n=1 Tax=Actinocorallia sp. API 0066 TaxID=2896846 RepID=UPI001E432062|nr:hypothetical protein [Actinocorallia sp. API 0066]MCD0452598.1 hypothetical protein [Actinocorallia sp. API 0066]